MTTSVEGRRVAAEAPYSSPVREGGSTPDEAAINIGGEFFLVSKTQVRWSRSNQVDEASAWHVINLPQPWNQLGLKQIGRSVIVRVDGHELVAVQPPA